ncbi:branched-chain amino acid transport system permease protein [Spinactinospora alkalitolerans]|uniref:Branched-chain amino acid transport system permease protein n=1 Tax=Spinactinospora alkalitolerans TaxID=687207 RepID=A0A852TNU0_9ACTN|nr:branched-chain amino acid ABC transporter permease [Spinactinospora alkalitolerans]NYE45618.1 branched-chain amino acid transport system permease protein [Spinactinospora alkalitolerans]
MNTRTEAGPEPLTRATAPRREPAPALRARLRPWLPTAITAAALLCLPYSTLRLPGLFDGPLNSPATLQLLATCLVFAGLATSYDLLYGRLGLLSFGHALYFAAGAYAAALLMHHLRLPLAWSALIAVAAGTALAVLLGAVSLRVSGIALAMVTLAFAQAGSILIARDPGRATGGEEGLSLDTALVPGALIGVVNTVNLYWIALGYAAVALAVVWWLAASPIGRVWNGIRANEQRVSVLGLNPYPFKLIGFVVGAALASLGGVVFLLVAGGVTPAVSTAEFTLTLLVMVSLGGAGTRWGPVLGGVLYTYVDHRLVQLSGAPAFDALPPVLRAPLSQPLFILGLLFVAAVFFFPGGLAALPGRVRARWSRGS